MKSLFLFLILMSVSIVKADVMVIVHKAQSGDVDAQVVLAYMYDNGEVFSVNPTLAVEWYTKAAKAGSVKAQLILAYKYDLGDGVKQDHKQALYWYTKAAEQGNARAQESLAGMYTFGEGVPIDYVTAYAWFNIAASSGLEMAKRDRDFLASKMTPSQIEKGQELSKELYQKINQTIMDRLGHGDG